MNEEQERQIEEIREALLEDSEEWTKQVLLEHVVDEMRLTTRRNKLYREMSRKRRDKLIDYLTGEYPDDVIEWWNSLEDAPGEDSGGEENTTDDTPTEEPTEEQTEGEELFGRLNTFTKNQLALIAYNLGIFDSLEEAEGERKADLIELIQEEEEAFVGWVDGGMEPREEPEEPEEPEVELVPLELELLQLGNMLAITEGYGDQEPTDEALTKALGMDYVGPYAYFDCSTRLKLNGFVSTMEQKEDAFLEWMEKNKGKKTKSRLPAGALEMDEEYWNRIYHYRALLNQNPKGDRLVIMQKAQAANIRNFFQEKRTRAKPKSSLARDVNIEIWPIVVNQRVRGRVQRKLMMMAYREKQEEAFKKLAPSRFKSTYQKQTWALDNNGFWLSLFVNKTAAKAWVRNAAKVMEENGYLFSNMDNVLAEIDDTEFKVLRTKNERNRLEGDNYETTRYWGDVPDRS